MNVPLSETEPAVTVVVLFLIGVPTIAVIPFFDAPAVGYGGQMVKFSVTDRIAPPPLVALSRIH